MRWSGVAVLALFAALPWRASAQSAAAQTAAAQTAAAQTAAAPKALVITATNLTAADARQREQGGRRDQDAVLPGDIIRYQLRFTNTTKRAVREVVFTDPVPAGLHFVASPAPARNDVAVTYSIDGGRSYSPVPVVETVVDGKRVTRPAAPASYTHVRWTVLGWVQPDAHVTVEFRAGLASTKPAPKVAP